MKRANTVHDRIKRHARARLYRCLVHPHSDPQVAAFQLEGAYQQFFGILEKEESYGFVLDGAFHDMAEDEVAEVEEEAFEALLLPANSN